MVLRGEQCDRRLNFVTSPYDELSLHNTPAGSVEVLTLWDRVDFEHCIQALAYRCEPRTIPPSMGASTIRGLIDWGKIQRHREAYFLGGGRDWHQEFKRFTAEKSNYLNCLIVLSSGYYSSIESKELGLTPDEWNEKSLIIRKYHELTHFVCRELYPNEIDVVRDEVIADMIGMVAAFGEYDTELAKLFLGIEGLTYRVGGRLENYIGQDDNIEEVASNASHLINELAELNPTLAEKDALSLLLQVMDHYVI